MDIRGFTNAELARYIQFTKTAPWITKKEIIVHFETCGEYSFNAAMVPMHYVPLGKEILRGTGVKIATFFGFGMGHETINAKIGLMKECLKIGADEVDYQPNMSVFLSGEYDLFEKEAQAMLDASVGLSIKPMLEVEMIPSLAERIRAIKIFDNLGYFWIKNSSGAPTIGHPANPEVIKLLREHVRPECKIKASGNINTFEKMVELFDAGAEMAGTSHGWQILQRKEAIGSGY